MNFSLNINLFINRFLSINYYCWAPIRIYPSRVIYRTLFGRQKSNIGKNIEVGCKFKLNTSGVMLHLCEFMEYTLKLVCDVLCSKFLAAKTIAFSFCAVKNSLKFCMTFCSFLRRFDHLIFNFLAGNEHAARGTRHAAHLSPKSPCKRHSLVIV